MVHLESNDNEGNSCVMNSLQTSVQSACTGHGKLKIECSMAIIEPLIYLFGRGNACVKCFRKSISYILWKSKTVVNVLIFMLITSQFSSRVYHILSPALWRAVG